MQRPPLEPAREHDVGLGREDVTGGLDPAEDPLEVPSVAARTFRR
jgi:hypothetical protein